MKKEDNFMKIGDYSEAAVKLHNVYEGSNDTEAQIGEFSLEIKSATIPTVYNK